MNIAMPIHTPDQRLPLLAGFVIIAALALPSFAQGSYPEAPSPDTVAGNELPQPDPDGAEALQDLADPPQHPGQAPHTHPPHDSAASAEAPELSPAEHRAFARSIDLSGLRNLAVFDNGRVKTVETLAQEQIQRIYGRSRWRDPETAMRYDPVFTYFDLIFNHDYYLDRPIIHVEVLPLLRRLTASLDPERIARWTDGSRVSPRLLAEPEARAILEGQGSDLRFFEAQQQVLRASDAMRYVGHRLLMVSPPRGQSHWAHLADLADPRLAAGESIRAATGVALSAEEPETVRRVNDSIYQLASAWRNADAGAVNAALDTLTEQIPRINPATYPPRWQLTLEAIYNATHKFTLGYLAYLMGTIALLIAFAVGRKWIITTGVVFAVAGFAIHSGGMVVRGLLSGRWPIHNQFESFIAFTWFAVLAGLALMVVRRQWLFGAAATALGTCALLLANVVEIPSQSVAPDPGILATSNILYIHVNVVLASYALIALAFFLSLIYLAVHYFGNGKDPGASGTGGGDGGGHGDGGGALAIVRFAAAGLGHGLEANRQPAAAAAGGEAVATATPAIFDRDDEQWDTGGITISRGRDSLLHDLDRAQIIVLQLAFWTLGTGILLGAYWADHAWGRWWGWDPKEVWSLITWIVYLIAIHARFGVKRRGLVTAWLSVVGFFVMLWTYWGVNLLLAGLHSYA